MTINHPMSPAAHQRQPTRRNTWLIIAAAALAVLLICLFAVRFAAGSPGAVDTPSGLTTSIDRTGVKAAWTGVSDADRYQLVRDDTTVVYDGDATTFLDERAATGQHRYTVRAVSSDGAVSSASAPSEATVGASWGDYTPYVKQFPDLLPQTPDATGWQGLECYWLLSGFDNEMGTAENGSGTVLGRKRIACDGPVAVSIGWLDSTQATNAMFAKAARIKNVEAVKWRFGTGYYDPSTPMMHLRPDNHANVWIGIAANGGTKQTLLDAANDLPLE